MMAAAVLLGSMPAVKHALQVVVKDVGMRQKNFGWYRRWHRLS